MKKIVITSLVALFAIPAVASASVLNDNPMYRPDAGKFYSVTTLASHSENTDVWALGEEFGYGITDKLSVNVATLFAEADGFDASMWGDFSIGLNYRVLDEGNWKADVFGAYALTPVWGNHASFLDQDLTSYAWTIGARVGYVAADWTVAGHFAFDYLNTESFNWGDEGSHRLRAGIAGQYLIDSNWGLVARAEYTGFTDDGLKDAGSWTGTFGINYNIDNDMFVGAFVGAEMSHATGDWEFEDGVTFGAKFGIQF